jgi:2-dehydro-3-deoxyphosphooctonate aldolase (KDO 8-P synthase)
VTRKLLNYPPSLSCTPLQGYSGFEHAIKVTHEKKVMTKKITVTQSVTAGSDSKLLIISGPCQLESRDHALFLAENIRDLIVPHGFNYVFKSSYDKANRTSLKTARGVGIDEGLTILETVKKETGCPVTTDVHTVEEVKSASSVVDILQIPAFLCRQTDLLIAAGQTKKAVNIKKGQFLHPADMKYAAEKVSAGGNDNILLTERGSCFGFRDLIVDMRGFDIMKQSGYPVVFDATHSVQSMGGEGGSSGGNRQYIRTLIRAATAVGIHGLFIECHENPDCAPSDGKSMLSLSELGTVLKEVKALCAALPDSYVSE